MKIQKLTLDDADQKAAIQAFLATKGITMPIHSVIKPYSWSDLEVTFEFEVEKPDPECQPTPEEAAASAESASDARQDR